MKDNKAEKNEIIAEFMEMELGDDKTQPQTLYCSIAHGIG